VNFPEGPSRPQLSIRNSVSGLALIRKPAGMTSFKTLGAIKTTLGTGKVGHAGTLDKFASGLLLVLAGSYTRLVDVVSAGEKDYRGTIRFGFETDTLDPEGVIIASAEAPTLAAIESALPRFLGQIEQKPPAYSALHVDGKRAYERALAGEEFEMPARKISIRSIEIESYDGRDAVLRVRCGPGTYIRSLARDMGLACGSRASLAALERLAIGPFTLDEAVVPEEFDPESHLRRLTRSEAEALGLGVLDIAPADVRRFSNGMSLDGIDFELKGEATFCEGLSAVFNHENRLLGIIETSDGKRSYRIVLGEPA
jgi:tRNA pseudouridine55 synthase